MSLEDTQKPGQDAAGACAATPGNPSSVRTLVLVVALSLAFIAAAVSGIMPLGIPGQWVFPHIGDISRFVFPSIEICTGLAIGLAIIFLAVARPHAGTIPRKILFWRFALIVFAGLYFDWTVLLAGRIGLSENIYAIFDDYACGYYEEAVKIKSLPEYMSEFHARQGDDRLINHKSVHPPGRILLSYFTYQAVKKSPMLEELIFMTLPGDAAFAFKAIDKEDLFPFMERTSEVRAGAMLHIYLFLLLLALGKIAVFATIMLLFNPDTALRNAALFCFVPAPILFLPHYDCFLGALAAILFLMAIISTRLKGRMSALLVLFCGAYSCACVLFSMAFGVPSLWAMAFWFFSSIREGRFDYRSFLAKYVLPFAAGISVVVVFLQAAFSFPMVAVLLKCLHNNEIFFQNQSTRTLIWKILNPVEFLAGTGIPVMILLACCLWHERKKIADILRNNFPAGINPVAAASAIIFLFLICTPTRAEVSRQWSCAWPAVYLVLPLLLDGYGAAAKKLVATISCLLVLQILLFRFFIKIVLIER